ncbi:Hypothetical predicted protein [Pelobates cultripes]|uniref:Uncharacterized protein n=1 Tax=Pelobates cultripes TaxID=61616 RepID=A0AAD1SQK9_PELCU|nr:Hypothetical predicted protein [Pelobates cultripes]
MSAEEEKGEQPKLPEHVVAGTQGSKNKAPDATELPAYSSNIETSLEAVFARFWARLAEHQSESHPPPQRRDFVPRTQHAGHCRKVRPQPGKQ